MAEVLVTGATGTLGSHVARRLLDRGHCVRALSRGGRVPIAGAEAVRGDLASGEGLEEASRGLDAIVHCATAGGSLSSRTLRATDVEGTRRLLAAAHRSASPHVLYPSIVGIDEIPFAYCRAKLAEERIVEDSGLPWTILRATSRSRPARSPTGSSSSLRRAQPPAQTP